MWGNFANLTKQITDNASQFAASSGFEEHLSKAKSSLTGGLDALASNILTVEPAGIPETTARQVWCSDAQHKSTVRPYRHRQGPSLRTMHAQQDVAHKANGNQHLEPAEEAEDGWVGEDDIGDTGSAGIVEEEQEGDAHSRAPGAPAWEGFMEVSLDDRPVKTAAQITEPAAKQLVNGSGDKLKAVQQRNKELLRENAALRKRIGIMAEEMDEQKHVIGKLQEERDRLIQSEKECKDTATDLEDKLSVLEEHNNRLERQLKVIQQELEQSRNLAERYATELREARVLQTVSSGNESEALHNALADVKSYAVSSQKLFLDLSSALKTVSSAVKSSERASQQQRETGSKVVSLEAELAAARIANDAAPLCDVVELLSQELAASSSCSQPQAAKEEGVLTGSDAKIQNDKIASLERSLRQRDREIQEGSHLIHDLQKQVSNLSACLEKTEAESAEAIEAFQAKLRVLENQRDAAASQAKDNEALRADIEGLTAALHSALRDADSKSAGEAALTAQLHNVMAEVEGQREYIAKLKSEIKASRQVVNNQKLELQQLQQALGDSQNNAATHMRDAEGTFNQRIRTLQAELEDCRVKHEEAIEGYCAELDAVHAKLDAKDAFIKALEEKLGAIQEGSTASHRLAQDRLAEMQAKMKAAEERAEELSRNAMSAEASASAAMEAAASAQKNLMEREEQIFSLQTKIAKLTEELARERQAAEAEKQAAEKQFDAILARQIERARSDARAEGAASRDDTVASLHAELKLSREKVREVEIELAASASKLHQFEDIELRVASLEAENQSLQTQLKQALLDIAASKEAAEAAAQESASHRAIAAERTKKFALLQAQYRKKEESIIARAEAAEAALLSTQSSSTSREYEVEEALNAKLAAEQKLEAALLQIDQLLSKVATLQTKLEDQAVQCDIALSKVAALEVSLEAAKASSEVNTAADKQYFERMVAAEVSTRVAAANKALADAQAEVARLQIEIAASQERAAIAEQAKIEMSLVLAQLDENSQINKPISGLPTGGRAELLQEVTEKAEEAELAAAVSMRRAMTAERELAEARQQLQEMERKAKDLSWQVKMLSEPGDRTAGSDSDRKSGMFADMFGCGGVRPSGR